MYHLLPCDKRVQVLSEFLDVANLSYTIVGFVILIITAILFTYCIYHIWFVLY